MRKSRHSLSSAICPLVKWLTLPKVRSQIFPNYATRLTPFLTTSQCYFVVRSKVDQCDIEMWKYPKNYGYDNLAMMITRILRSFPKSEQTLGCQDSVFCLLNQCLDFQSGTQASSSSITWEPVRNAESRAPPQIHYIRNSRAWGTASCVWKGPADHSGAAGAWNHRPRENDRSWG